MTRRLPAGLALLVSLVVSPVTVGGPPDASTGRDPGVVRAAAGVDVGAGSRTRANRPLPPIESEPPTGPSAQPAEPRARPAAAPTLPVVIAPDAQVVRSAQTVALFGLVSLAPAAVLMLTAFVRINVVLVLLRQALGSPQVPGNQVLTALALLLTALVMRPVCESLYAHAVEPAAAGRMSWAEGLKAASGPVKSFMLEQLERTGHEDYLWAIHDAAASAPAAKPPVYGDDFSFGEVATSFLLSELTTALVIGFYLYLPFLVVDLVVSAVLSAMGLFMLPPSLVALPLKLILFVLVDGWVRVAAMLLQSFGPTGA
jgi:flagellar biosynthetic protein FliP